MSQLQKKFIENNAVDESKIRLNNNGSLKVRNNANIGDVSILKLNTSDQLVLEAPLVVSGALSSDIVPDASDTRNLGSASLPFSNVWTYNLNASGHQISVDASALDMLNNPIQNVDGMNLTNNLDMGSNLIINLADPTAAQHAATKAYVDAVAQGLKPKAAVRAASTANLDISTDLQNGDTLDGVTLATGDRVLLKDQTAAEDNGIYIVVASGAASRSSDFDSLTPIDEINGAYTFVREGSQAGIAYVVADAVATLGTDPINFVYFNAAGSLTGGDMITISSNIVSVDLASASGLESSNPGNAAGQLRIKLEASNPSLKFTGSNELAVKLDAAGAIASGASGLAVQVDGSTIEINTNALRVKAAGINENHLNTSVAGAGLAGGGGSALSVNVDDSTIEINSDTLRVKDAGITSAKLSSNSVVGDKVLKARYTITLNGTDITNQYVDITSTHKLAIESVVLQVRGGLVQEYNRDYDVDNSGSQSRIRFDSTNLPSSDLATGGAAALVSGDVLLVQGIRNS